MPRYKLRTLLALLAIGPPMVWLLAWSYDVYLWLATYPGPDPVYITGPEPLRWIRVFVIAGLLAIPSCVVAAIVMRRRHLTQRDRQERRRSGLFSA